ncbi:uncharacterized protein EDB91DRAFT_1251149 [Suillus paluster]|uniref:uncharacterized protein n=1 Tax=Suillus paluster TaxID=48578 RepID=UPI001B879D72|nr:uncharacterized protein EDB91DRAFT_1251149 [Suillus paluster]KAG1734102.1 hypothetical protein EDB91DRAFT_1251149 [Suillus paluster]
MAEPRDYQEEVFSSGDKRDGYPYNRREGPSSSGTNSPSTRTSSVQIPTPPAHMEIDDEEDAATVGVPAPKDRNTNSKESPKNPKKK